MAQPFNQRFFALAPKVITGIFRKYEQGKPMMGDILPSRGVPQYHFIYHLYGKRGHMTPKVEAGSESNDVNIQYEEKLAICNEYREGATISEREMMGVADVRNVLADHSQVIAESIMLRKEYVGLQALLDNDPYNDLANNGMVGPVTQVDWSQGSSDIFGTIVDAKNNVRKAAFLEADTMIISPDDVANIMKNPDFRQYQLGGNVFGQEILRDGSIGRIHGLQAYMHNLVVDIEQGKPKIPYPNEPGIIEGASANQQRMLDATAIILKRGRTLGHMAQVEYFTTDLELIKGRRAVRIQAWEGFGPAIERPPYINYILTDGRDTV